MRQVQQTIFALLGLSLVLLLLIVGGFVFQRITYQPSIYTPPSEVKTFSSVNLVREATSIEGLRQVCEMWAKSEDQNRAYVSALNSQFTALFENLSFALALAAGTFATGLTYVYVILRRLQRKHENAL